MEAYKAVAEREKAEKEAAAKARRFYGPKTTAKKERSRADNKSSNRSFTKRAERKGFNK
jgi:hypothetical protein